SIVKTIANDKITVAKNFERKLNKQIENLVHFPYKFRPSHYFEDTAYRDMIFQGYTIIYKVEEEKILILDIFKWQDR
ncbi:MAG: type II toxin-antitoxin system RelE/ParE family toxin, partial [Campylobacterales bacterium]